MSQATEDQDQQPEKPKEVVLLENAVAKLMEHFDTVQIFAMTDRGHDAVMESHFGAGNWHARYGQVKHWIILEEERTRTRLRE